MRPCDKGSEFELEPKNELESPSHTQRLAGSFVSGRESIREGGGGGGAGAGSSKVAQMPAVGMRRSTRVFVPKSADGKGFRVLRSGRRLWVDSVEGNKSLNGGGTAKEADSWLQLIDDSKGNRWRETVSSPDQEGAAQMVLGADDAEAPNFVPMEPSLLVEGDTVDRRFGNVYYRQKRKSFGGESCKNLTYSQDPEDVREKMYRLHYVRRQKRRKHGERCSTSDIVEGHELVLSVSVEPSSSLTCRFDGVLGSILRRMTVVEVGLGGLSAFLMSVPIVDVFASCGITFFLNIAFWASVSVIFYLNYGVNRRCTRASYSCQIFGAVQFIPMFTVHISAVHCSFIYLHTKMLFRYAQLSFSLLLHRVNTQKAYRGYTGFGDELQHINIGHNIMLKIIPDPYEGDFGIMELDVSSGDLQDMDVDVALGDAGVMSEYQNLRHRISNNARTVQKRRRRSLRTRKARNPSLLGLHSSHGSLLLNRSLLKRNSLCDTSTANDRGIKRLDNKIPATEAKLMKSMSVALKEDIDSVSCSGNILVIESDKCYRDEGASIVLETNDSNECVLAVKKGGLTKYAFKAPKDMKPTSINRFTHAVMWAGECGWKLEFPERREWAIFKELARVCDERNLVPPSPVVKIIPVPGVQEVPPVAAADSDAFDRPGTYIKLSDDELTRALSRRTANYDMDSEDEQWLNGYNCQLSSGHEPSEPVSEEIFELTIDAFEKASYCNREDSIDSTAAVELAANICRIDAVEAVHNYWVKKRTVKRGSLLRVFQLNQPRQIISKPLLRKKRSFKRQTSHVTRSGKGKDRSILEAMVAEQKAQEEQIVMRRLQEARCSANRALEIAIRKRQRAQFLMENADLAMYRAAIALSIAHAAQVAQSAQAAAHFLD